MKRSITIIAAALLLACVTGIQAQGPITLTSNLAQTNSYGNLESWDMILARIAKGINSLYLLTSTNVTGGDINVTNVVAITGTVTNYGGGDVNVTNIVNVVITNVGTTYPLLSASDTWQRPDDQGATPYTAGDAMTDSESASTILSFEDIVDAAGKGGHIVRVEWFTVQPTNTAAVRLHLFNSSSVLVPNDNAAWAVAITNLSSYIGYVDVTTMNNMGGFAYGQSVSGESKLPLAFKTTSTADLFGVMETKNAFTPLALQTNKVVIYVQQ